MAEPDSRNSLRHILADDPAQETPAEVRQPSVTAAQDQSIVMSKDEVDEDMERDPDTPQYTSTTQTTRRNANGSVSSVYSGNKIKHLKKEDGVPLWRKDIQFEFLQIVFEDQNRVFTQYSDRTPGHTFAEIYIDSMAKSSKTSKILKEKLAQDHSSAVSMAMVCLLVNVGRMNTTLNFFPEMRAQLRTYHSIPALQAHQDPNAYKQLQDAPRLKSILKGASEDDPQPGTIEEIKSAQIPRTNPVNLIFVLAQYAPKISEVHFTPPRDFFDLVMRPTLSSKSRATAFLWLLWWYLESNFTHEDSQRNPFGPGLEGEGTGGLPIKVPTFDVLTEDQAALENVDTEEEQVFGEMKRKERISIVASEPSPAMTALKRARKERSLQSGFAYVPSDNEGTNTPSRDYQSPVPHGSAYSNTVRDYASSEQTRSPSPPPTSSFQAVNLAPKPSAGMNINNLLSSDGAPPQSTPPPTSAPTVLVPPEKKKGPGRGNWRRKEKSTPSHEPRPPQPILPSTAQFKFVHGSPDPHTPALSSTSAYQAGAGLSPVSTFSATGGQQKPTLAPAPSASSGGGDVAANQPSHVPTPSYQSSKRSRPQSQHQVAISEYRRNRISYILECGTRSRQRAHRANRLKEGSVLRAWKRIRLLPSGWDSEEEEGKLIRESEKREEEGKPAEGGKLGKGDVSLAARRPIGGVWMAGFVLPGGKEVEDVGEAFREAAGVFARLQRRTRHLDESEAGELVRRAPAVRRKRVRRREEEFPGFDFATEIEGPERPRLPRKSGGAGGAKRGKKAAKVAARGVKEELASSVPPDAGADEDEMDVDEGAGDLDEEDRELLGEVDADEDESEDEDEGMDDA